MPSGRPAGRPGRRTSARAGAPARHPVRRRRPAPRRRAAPPRTPRSPRRAATRAGRAGRPTRRVRPGPRAAGAAGGSPPWCRCSRGAAAPSPSRALRARLDRRPRVGTHADREVAQVRVTAGPRGRATAQEPTSRGTRCSRTSRTRAVRERAASGTCRRLAPPVGGRAGVEQPQARRARSCPTGCGCGRTPAGRRRGTRAAQRRSRPAAGPVSCTTATRTPSSVGRATSGSRAPQVGPVVVADHASSRRGPRLERVEQRDVDPVAGVDDDVGARRPRPTPRRAGRGPAGARGCRRAAAGGSPRLATRRRRRSTRWSAPLGDDAAARRPRSRCTSAASGVGGRRLAGGRGAGRGRRRGRGTVGDSPERVRRRLRGRGARFGPLGAPTGSRPQPAHRAVRAAGALVRLPVSPRSSSFSALEARAGALGAAEHALGPRRDVELRVEVVLGGGVGLRRVGEAEVERLVDQLPARDVVPVDERDRDARWRRRGRCGRCGAGRSSRPRGTGS